MRHRTIIVKIRPDSQKKIPRCSRIGGRYVFEIQKPFPHGEAVTDEGLASPYGRGAPQGAERVCFTLSVSFADSSHKVGAKEDCGKRIARPGTGPTIS